MEEINCSLKKVDFKDLGRIRYKDAWDYQQKLFDTVIKEKLEKKNKSKIDEIFYETVRQYLLFCEHEHVYTIGKSGNRQNLLIAKIV